MNKEMIMAGKQELKEALGSSYPKSREELQPSFLLEFAKYVSGPDEADFGDYSEYEDAKYGSEQWRYISKFTEAFIALQQNSESGKAAWNKYVDWVIEKYFPEFNMHS